MRKPTVISEVELPVAEYGDLAAKAAVTGVSMRRYLGILVLTAAYGALHPDVTAYRKRANPGVSGPETPGSGD